MDHLVWVSVGVALLGCHSVQSGQEGCSTSCTCGHDLLEVRGVDDNKFTTLLAPSSPLGSVSFSFEALHFDVETVAELEVRGIFVTHRPLNNLVSDVSLVADLEHLEQADDESLP